MTKEQYKTARKQVRFLLREETDQVSLLAMNPMIVQSFTRPPRLEAGRYEYLQLVKRAPKRIVNKRRVYPCWVA